MLCTKICTFTICKHVYIYICSKYKNMYIYNIYTFTICKHVYIYVLNTNNMCIYNMYTCIYIYIYICAKYK